MSHRRGVDRFRFLVDFAFGARPRCPAAPPPTRREIAAVIVILAIAFALRVLLATHFPNIHHPDELFQYLEQGHRVAFGYGVVPWEFRDGSRSWLLPGFLGGIMWLTSSLGGGAAAYLAVIAGVLSAFSLSTVLVAWLWARRLAGPEAGLLAAVVAATWFELVYFGAKPLTEALASETLLLSAFFLCSVPRPTRTALLAGGALLGLTLVLRVHLTPAIAFVALAGCLRSSSSGWFACGAAFAFVVIAAGSLDWATWGNPFYSFWANVEANLVHDKASQFGVSPWYGYVRQYAFLWSGFVVPLAIVALYGARRAPLLLIVPALIVASHSVIGHKEYRFIFPSVPFVLLAASFGTADAAAAMKRAWPSASKPILIAAAMLIWVVASGVLISGDRFRPNLTRQAAQLMALSNLREGPAACGIGLVDIPWYESGGYTYLHRNIPIFAVRDARDLTTISTAFDAAIARSDAGLEAMGYELVSCYPEYLCLYRRRGPCHANPESAINENLRRSNQ